MIKTTLKAERQGLRMRHEYIHGSIIRDIVSAVGLLLFTFAIVIGMYLITIYFMNILITFFKEF